MPPKKAPPLNSGPKPAKSKTLSQLGALVKDERSRAMLIYGLLLFIPMSMGATGVLAITLIYLVQDDATDLTRSHYIFQSNTFWYGIGGIIATLLALAIRNRYLSYVFFIPTFLWIIGRCVIGFNHLLRLRPHPEPKTLWA